MKISIWLSILVLWVPLLKAQEKAAPKFHSHNDYLRQVPFWTAFSNGAASIEADVILQEGKLMVAHEQESIREGRTLQSLYLDPIRQAKSLGIGKLDFQLLVDIKSEAYSSMELLEDILRNYEDILAIPGKQSGVRVVVSGSRPSVEDYEKYPSYLFFDYQETDFSNRLPWHKIAMVSLPFGAYSSWNGLGRLVHAEEDKLTEVIEKTHRTGRPIRFWGTPDTKTSWKTFSALGVDLINTDQPFEAGEYLKNLSDHVISDRQMHSVYQPEFEADGVKMPIRRVILMIGDGNGLAHISSGMYAHGNNLNITQLRHIGLVKTQSADDFVTDSAAGATALATGQKVNNRAIACSPAGTPLASIPELLQEYRFSTGVVTTDRVTGATPAAFYAHREDRGMVEEIAEDLARSPLDLFIGGGKNDFLYRGRDLLTPLENAGIRLVKSLNELNSDIPGRAGYFGSNQDLPTVAKGRRGFLNKAVIHALTFLGKKKKPFFLMIEGAMIDTGGHKNSAETVVEEEIDFDEAVGTVIRYADQHPGTLVIITADHETGGVNLSQGNLSKGEVELGFSTTDHTGIMVPLFAYGPHADEFIGVYENTLVFEKIMGLISRYYEAD